MPICSDLRKQNALWEKLREILDKRLYGVSIQWSIETGKSLDQICKMILDSLEYDRKEVMKAVPPDTLEFIQELYKKL